MAISYNKHWELLSERKISVAALQKMTGIAPNTMTRLRRDEEITLTVPNRVCSALDANIGDIMEFVKKNSKMTDIREI